MGGENVAQLKIRLSEGPQQASIFDRLPAKCQSRRFQDEFDREHRKCPGFVIFFLAGLWPIRRPIVDKGRRTLGKTRRYGD
jgi:hypothetical protein